MTNRVQQIIAEVLENKDLYSPIDAACAIDEVADKILEECFEILKNQQGTMNQRADHARYLAEEIKWKMTEHFPHLDNRS